MEQTNNRICYFLGANTAEGFTSFYKEFARSDKKDYIWYIKGGPGNGKSTFMRRIAQQAEKLGENVEYAFCSGDPDSLDGIYLRDRHTAYIDATSPHIQEPEEPAASGRYLDLSGCFLPGLEGKTEEIRQCFKRYREQYERCYQLMRAAALTAPEKTPGILREEDRQAVRERAAAFASRYLQPGGGAAQEYRFLSAYTCRGKVFFWKTAGAVGRVCTLDNTLGLADVFLKEISLQCREKNCPCILCSDPLQSNALTGILIPSNALALIAIKKRSDYPGDVWKHLRLDAMAEPSSLRIHRDEFRRCAGIQTGLLDQAEFSLREAKRFHDELESIYKPYLDITKIESILEEHINRLF